MQKQCTSFQAPERRILRFTRRDERGRTFLSITQTDRRVTRADLERFEPKSNQQAVVRIVVKAPDGSVHVFSASSKKGEIPDLEFLEEQAKRNARGGLGKKGIQVTTHDVGKATIRRDYLTRTFSK